MSSEPHLPWFRVIKRHERWVSERLDSPEFHEHLLRYASTRDARARAWLAEALSRQDFVRASRFATTYLIVALVAAPFVAASARGCGVALLLFAVVPPLFLFDRWNRRRKAARALADGKASIYSKTGVTAEPGSRVFQSYWSKDDLGRYELDHPAELRDAVENANEWWLWEMPVPREQRSRTTWTVVQYDIGLVRREEGGRRVLLAGGVVYFSYDPWTKRVDTGGHSP